ncbi:FG-GAP-like repeat-containing protein [bacterium]|jgi:hypothetical protein|nr:FG-GAP-like repeat-containing protein [Verrucomicrobiota bacterium]MDA7644777.1 FG-GAP-like repeat-containing protein [bacterium]
MSIQDVISKLDRMRTRLLVMSAAFASSFLPCSEIVGATVGYHSASQEILLPFGQGGFEVGDLNHDGHPDILVTLQGVATLYLNDGVGLFNESGNLFERVSVLGVTLFDADRDADLDAWVREDDGQVSIWINEPDGTFFQLPERVTVFGEGDVAFGDLDNDGDIDVVVARQFNVTAPAAFQFGGHYRWLNDGTGAFEKAEILRYDQAGKSVDGIGGELGDLDGDGDLDFLAVYSDHTFRIWKNDGAAGFLDSEQGLEVTVEQGQAPPAVGSVALGDFDDDGDLDVVKPVGGDRNWLWTNDGSANFSSNPIALSSVLSAVEQGDLDNDGDTDLIAAGAGCGACANVWLLNDGMLEEAGIRIFGDNATVHRLSIVDLDSDGDLDFVALVDVFEAPAGRAVVGMWLNGFIDLSVQQPFVGGITDPTLSSVMRQRLGLPPDLSVTPDYSGLSTLVISRSDFGGAFDPIENLDGIEEATDLERIEIEEVMDVTGTGGVLDLSFLKTLTKLRSLSLKGNGITRLILPEQWGLLETLWLDDNQLTQIETIDDYDKLKIISIPRNRMERFAVVNPLIRLQTLDLTDNPLIDLNLIAGIPELTPGIEAIRNRGADVALANRIRSQVPLVLGQPRLEVFADSGRYSVRRSKDFLSWNVIGEFEVSQANWPGVSFVDDTGTVGETAFYSIQRVEP